MMAMRPAFNEEDRERIRQGLLFYKESHNVGVPTMQLRIAEVVGDGNPDRVPLKSLQRFLAATHRTDDALVQHCAAFLERVAPPPPEARLGDLLKDFLIASAGRDEDYGKLSGSYHSYFKANDDAWTPYSVLTLEQAASPHYLIAHESVINTMRDSMFQKYGPEIFEGDDYGEEYKQASRYSGVFLYGANAGYVLLLRSYMHMRYCQLGIGIEKDPLTLQGTALEPILIPFIPNWSPDFRIKYLKQNPASDSEPPENE